VEIVINQSVARLYIKLSISLGLALRWNNNQTSAEFNHLGGSYCIIVGNFLANFHFKAQVFLIIFGFIFLVIRKVDKPTNHKTKSHFNNEKSHEVLPEYQISLACLS
jgi:hypothetical protein